MLEVIGAGVGRTGTYSLKLALEQLGFGPCHHMEEVLKDPERQIPLWSAAARGTADWESALAGYRSAVDWPTAAFWRELAEARPESWDGSGLLAHAEKVSVFIKNTIGITARIKAVAPDTLERSLGKAKRVYDKRPKG